MENKKNYMKTCQHNAQGSDSERLYLVIIMKKQPG